jgi:hypothetical protein
MDLTVAAIQEEMVSLLSLTLQMERPHCLLAQHTMALEDMVVVEGLV